MAVIDASVWISLFKEDDRFHDEAKNIVKSLITKNDKISIPALAFTEVAGVIRRTTQNRDAALDAVRYMKMMEPEIIADFEKLEPVATQIAVNYSVRGADACYLAVADLLRSRLYTFDQLQGKAFEELSKTW